MARRRHLALAVGLALVAAPEARAADCYDVSKGEPQTLTGTLDRVVFPGPPNYKDVQGGDEPEPSYVLRLADPICLKGDEFADPAKPFSAVQLLEADDKSRVLEPLLHRRVTVQLRGPLAAQSGHHHEPLVAWAVSAQLVARPPQQSSQEPEPEPSTQQASETAPPNAPLVEYGSAVSTVRAFYKALGDGQGEVASLLVAPQRRRIPAFNAAEMTRFYGGLKEPLRLQGIDQSGPDTYVVSYRYGTGTSVCEGKAVVTTRSAAGAAYVDSIRALDGC